MSTAKNKQGMTREDKALYARCVPAMKEEYPLIYAFLEPLALVNNSKRVGKARVSYLYLIFRGYGKFGRDTRPRDLVKDADTFWDLADVAAGMGSRRHYAMDTLFLIYRYLGNRKEMPASFCGGLHSPAYMFWSNVTKTDFYPYMLHRYDGREKVFFLRHGQMKQESHFLVLDYRNGVLRDLLIEAIMQWPDAWRRRRRPSRLDLLKEAEAWFEGTTDGVRSWEDFDARMLDTAKRHILRHYEPGPWRTAAMRLLFFFFKGLVLSHPEHDFFAGSYIYCPELVVDSRIPLYLADGYEVAVSGQRDSFRQGHGVLFVLLNADRISASSHRIEIRRYDLSKIENPVYWDALANFILHNDRSDTIEARYFLIWLNNRKKALCEDPCRIMKEDMDAYRVVIASRMPMGDSRTTAATLIRRVVRWLSSNEFLTVDADALDDFSNFIPNYRPASSPMTKEVVTEVIRRLHEKGQSEPRYLLSEILFRILLVTDPRCGSVVSLALDGIRWLDDGRCRLEIKQKTSGRMMTSFYLPKDATDLLRQAVALTQPLRERYPMLRVSESVFIYQTKNSPVPVHGMDTNRFNNDLKEVADDICHGLSSGIIRDTMYTLLNLYMIDNGIRDTQRPYYTHHVRPRSIKAYAVITIQDIMARVGQVTIGKVLDNA